MEAPRARLGWLSWIGLLGFFGLLIYAFGHDRPYVYVDGHAYWRGELVAVVLFAVVTVVGIAASQDNQ